MKLPMTYGLSRRLVSRAFTLVELIVVIVIVGILAAIAVVGFSATVDRTQAESAETSALSVSRQMAALVALDRSADLQDHFDSAHSSGDFSNLTIYLVDSSGMEMDMPGDAVRDVDWDLVLSTGGRVRVCNSAGWSADMAPLGDGPSGPAAYVNWRVSSGVEGCDGGVATLVTAPPSTPTLSVTPNDGFVTVSVGGFSPSEEVSSIYYSLDGGLTWLNSGNVTPFDISPLPNGTPVTIVVQLENELGFSSSSPSVTVIPAEPFFETVMTSAVTSPITNSNVAGFGAGAVLSGDGKSFVTGYRNGSSTDFLFVYTLDESTNAWVRRGNDIPTTDFAHRNLAISTDGERVIAADHTTKAISVWDYNESTGLWDASAGPRCSDTTLNCVFVSNFGERMATSPDGTKIGMMIDGTLFLFERDPSTGSYVETASKSVGTAALSGFDMSADGEMVVMSTINNSLGVATWVRSGSTFNLSGTPMAVPNYRSHPALDIDGEQVALSADGTRLIVGSYEQNATVYTRVGSAWSPLGAPVATSASAMQAEGFDGVANGSTRGYTVDISADGTTIAVGAPKGFAYSMAGEGYNFGWTALYDWSGVSWEPVYDALRTGDIHYASGYGESISLSDDGGSVLVARDGDGFDIGFSMSGSVIVYSRMD